ncbi:YcjF family protein [Leptolyngbya sp. FACHB-261]|uniref:YcjF family protein n=1 Tax=Leptolyngbya sp. FACHB-261 TaxID=2692806 RepID=UPI0016872D29|nr:GTP-binding protein [Leptolyngbya sp. FACHB-261]MBD2104143.1 DUF697 domain-containing protein [Leptolyngbya sp. FACHB-261]
MRPPRLLLFIAGLSLILGLMLWLVNSIWRLYIQVSFTAPPLAFILLVLLIMLLALVIAAFVYYGFLFQRPTKGRRPEPQVSLIKAEAAEETLRAVRQQVAQIQDEVSRRALLERSEDIEESFNRKEIQVLVFGTGSAGKTSLVNALIGRMAGQVGAAMGTTKTGQTYRFKLKGLERRILIIDSPGILEAGAEGTEREQEARHLATEADLLLFVVDNDLKKSEYTPLRALAEIGKRSLLVLNKIDRYTDSDRELILERLRERVARFISPEDVVAICANPNAFRTETGEILQPDPEILPLLRRMAAVLRAEGEDLVADNILLQSQRLGEEARRLIDEQRLRQAEKVVERFQWIGAVVICATPLPGIDLLATAAVNAQMVVEIARVYGCELNLERGRELAFSLAKTLASLGVVKGAIQLVTDALQLSVAGFLVGTAIQSVSAAYLTRIAGKSFIEYFRHDQDWGDGGITEVVQRQFQLNRRDQFVKSFVQEAINRVIRPLSGQSESEPEAPPEPPPRRR